MQRETATDDVIVIGGGINGAGIARDAAMRGLTVLLLEARDFGSGTSSWSSRLIHGGLRYLEYFEIPLVYESLHERRRLRRIASHLVKPLQITIPVYRGGRRPKWLVRLGMLAYDLLSLGKSLPRHRMLSRDELLDIEPGVNPDGLRGAAQYYDGQVTFAERLVIENIIDAAANGADVRNYSPVTSLEFGENGTHTVIYKHNGDALRATSRCIVNAAGPWVDRVLEKGNAPMPRLMGGTKGSHIVTGLFDGAQGDAFYVEATSDGRPIFILPWNDQYLIGTTDIRYDGDPADATASSEEIRYLLDATNAVFPGARLTIQDIHYAYAGVRPLPHQTDGPESAITRRHIIHRHDGRARGMLSVVGGKLTTYRHLAEQVVDCVEKAGGRNKSSCETGTTLLPGAGACNEAQRALASHGELSDAGRDRLLSVYGGRSLKLLELMREDPALAATLDASGTSYAAEVILAIRHEYARTLADIVHRRMMIGLSPDLGEAAWPGVATLAARELGWSDETAAHQIRDLEMYRNRLRASLDTPV
ncbi:MAG: glycerol-3-phosphate dehydrogenase [Woeseiaceae bacterium]|nr:glycerol-3-phosphate dehydrogenase [Woeseiaceae bacterium]